ncbi:MAG: glutamyl-tRNA reductase [Thermomicrobiales bacterium]
MRTRPSGRVGRVREDMRDHLIVLSASHERASVAARERLAVADEALPRVLERLAPGIEELAVLSTCNRTEYFAVVMAGQCPARTLSGYVSDVSGIARDDLDELVSIHLDREAIRHVLRVAAGLTSMVLGEPHILGQVRTAFERARECGASGPVLGRLGLDALTAGKRVRTVTGLARNRSTIPHVAVDLATRRLGSLAGITAVVVGAGEMGALAAQVLRGAGVGRLVVANRSEEHGRALAERVSGEYRPLGALAESLNGAHLVIAAAGGNRALIEPGMFSSSVAGDRAVVVMDLGVPRQVAPAVAELTGVSLLDLDSLMPIAEERRLGAAREAAMAELLIDAAGDAFMTWWVQRSAVPTIAAIRGQAEQMRDAELRRALRKLRHLSERDRNVVAALSVGLVNKLLHEPTHQLRQDADGELAAAARRLYGFDDLGSVLDARSDLALNVTLVAADEKRTGVA